jgi:hypothetical protein
MSTSGMMRFIVTILELPMFFLLGAMSVVLLGAGRLSLDGRSSA